MKDQYTLSPKAIDEMSEDFVQFLKESNYKEENITITRLQMEWYLLEWLDKHEGETVFADTKKILGRPHLYFKLSGEKTEPVEKEETLTASVTKKMQENAGMLPVYKYKSGVNILEFSPKIPDSVILIGSILLAVISALICLKLPAGILDTINNVLILPIMDIILGVIKMVGIPLLFISLVNGIIAGGSLAKVEDLGKKLFVVAFSLQFAVAAISMICDMFIFKIPFEPTNSSASRINEVISYIYSMIPVNIVEPFITNNCIQLLFLAFGLGVALMILNQKVYLVSSFMKQIFDIWMVFIVWANKLIAPLIFLIVFDLIVSGNVKYLQNAWPVFVVAVICAIFVLIFCIIRLKSKGLRVIKTLRTLFPIWFMATSTASSHLTYGLIYQTLTGNFKIKPSFVSFGVPFINTLTKIMVSSVFVSSAFYCASIEGLSISPTWLFICLVLSTILPSAMPPVTGGAAATYTLLLTQLGLPASYISIVIVLDMVLDFFVTGITLLVISIISICEAGDRDLIKNTEYLAV